MTPRVQRTGKHTETKHQSHAGTTCYVWTIPVSLCHVKSQLVSSSLTLREGARFEGVDQVARLNEAIGHALWIHTEPK
jgi:hypothetical protein